MSTTTLLQLYKSRLESLNAFSRSLDENDDCDGPFLMNEPSSKFTNSLHRILVVGQETNGWIGGFCGNIEADLDHNIAVYKRFNFGENYQSLFFQYAQEVTTRLTHDSAWMWSNLYKFGKDSGKGAPSDKINELELKYFDIFREEVQVINPTCVVFMTGPYYDSTLQERIPDATFSSMGNFTQRQLAKVKSQSLPEASYRIYHPGYGNRQTTMYHGTLDLIQADYHRLTEKSTQATPA